MPLQAKENHHSICWLMYSLFNNVKVYCRVHALGVLWIGHVAAQSPQISAEV